MSRGYIYVLINPALNNMLNIGKTTGTPEEKSKEISNGTGVPFPFHVAYSVEVLDCHAAEKLLHNKFESFRVNNSRDFFNVPLQNVIEEMNRLKNNDNLSVPKIEDEQEKLFQAIRLNNISKIREVLSRTTGILDKEYSKSEYKLPLILAVALNHKEIVRFLLDNGADVDSVIWYWPSVDDELSSQEMTALSMAARTGNVEIGEILINEYADRDIELTVDGSVNNESLSHTALNIAARFNHVKFIELLIEDGADIDLIVKETLEDIYYCEELFYPALMTAIYYGSYEAAVTLIENGADLEIKDYLGDRALSLACRLNRFSLVKLLIEKGANIYSGGWYNFESPDYGEKFYDEHWELTFPYHQFSKTPLNSAIQGGHLAILKYLTENGVTICEDGLGEILSIALDSDSFEILEYLTEIYLKSNFNFSSLLCESMESDMGDGWSYHSPELTEFLLNEGIRLNNEDFEKFNDKCRDYDYGEEALLKYLAAIRK